MVERANLYKCFEFLAANVRDMIVVSGIGFFDWLALTPEREANLPIGQMGTTVPLAMGIVCSLPHRKVLCLTTDGDLLMELGVLPPLGREKPKNMIVVVNDNEVYQQTHARKKRVLADLYLIRHRPTVSGPGLRDQEFRYRKKPGRVRLRVSQSRTPK
jgi:thiamine pyrophosphate-dependent acetolactate synthase large subunit-like protein